ncbi:GPI biosynthesis protein family pig-F domain-containing protein [Phthorimaea operculella]|nr:GPI biosynthesis protein family pig-F domain-containing protein [Phthorimaea operculella]
MFSLHNQLELRKVTVSSLITCIYLPSIITVVSYKGLLYSVGKGSSCYILVLIFLAELLKSFYLSSHNDVQAKKPKTSKTRARDIAKAFLTLKLVVVCYFVGIILFGAPFFDGHEETLMLSTLLTLLTVFPLIAHSGVETAAQLMFGVKSYGKDTIIEMLVNNAVLAVCGAWLGAVVIPLDWNTPWQVWPIPCYLGAIGGYLLSNVLTVLKITLMSAAQKYSMLNFLVNILNSFRVNSQKC